MRSLKLMICLNVRLGILENNRAMPVHDKPTKGKQAEKPSRQEEAVRIVEEYAAVLREIIKKLRRKLN